MHSFGTIIAKKNSQSANTSDHQVWRKNLKTGKMACAKPQNQNIFPPFKQWSSIWADSLRPEDTTLYHKEGWQRDDLSKLLRGRPKSPAASMPTSFSATVRRVSNCRRRRSIRELQGEAYF
eukprot:Filipodium_phascolosomae@DN662_c0_g1_i1.p1